MALKFCQGPNCHTYYTQDRLKGPKGNKTYQTRRRSNLWYGNNNFCDQRCLYDWVNKYNYQAGWNSERDYIYVNQVTKEQRPLTEQQYCDSNYTLNTGE